MWCKYKQKAGVTGLKSDKLELRLKGKYHHENMAVIEYPCNIDKDRFQKIKQVKRNRLKIGYVYVIL